MLLPVPFKTSLCLLAAVLNKSKLALQIKARSAPLFFSFFALEAILSISASTKKWAAIIFGMAFAAEILQILLAGRPAALSFLAQKNWTDVAFFFGAFSGVPACVLWIGDKQTRAFGKLAIPALAIGLATYAYLLFRNASALSSPSAVICILLAPLGVLAVILSLTGVRAKSDPDRQSAAVLFFWMAVALGALTLATNAGLRNNRFLYPATWDYFVYRIDGAYGGLAAAAAIAFEQASPLVQSLTTATYGLLIFAFFGILGLAIRQNDVGRLNVWRTLVLPYVFAFFLYSLLPLSGPIYAFFSGEFPHQMPAVSSVTAAQVVIPPAYRNGMPSMHLTGALLVWMLAIGLRHRVAGTAAGVLVLATAWSTLATGEHYVLDLIVALPFSAFLGSALIWPSRLNGSRRIAFPIWLAGALFLAWLALLRLAPIWLSREVGFVRAMSLLSMVVAGVVFFDIMRSAHTEKKTTSETSSGSRPLKAQAAPPWIIGTFVISGLAGLVYEVVYAKALAVTFGSTALASYTVLATYMGGMALGAWLGGHIADKSKSPLKVYAACEAVIGVYAMATPQLFHWIQAAYVHLSLDVTPDAPWLTPLRLTLGAGCLGVPTILMGATLPLMFKHLRSVGVSSSRAIAPLYAANVAGAAMGSVIASYFLLPAVGRNGGTYVAAIISLLIALYVIEKIKREPQKIGALDVDRIDSPLSGPAAVHASKSAGIVALCVLFIGGAVTLGLEVNSMHLLAVVAGNSVYAFGLMLAAFLAGLGFGSMAGERLLLQFSRLRLIVWAQCGIALAVALTGQLWDDVPSYFASFSLYPVPLSFSAREAIRALVCMVAMLPPAFFIGLSYPAAMSLATDWLSPSGGARGVGIASAINTFGNILGVVLVGFWLLPRFGSRDTALWLALIAVGLGAAAAAAERWRSNAPVINWSISAAMRWVPAGVASIALAFFPAQWNYNDLSSGANVYFSAQNWGDVIDHAESVEGGLTTVAKNANGVSVLLTNGKFQGNDSVGGEMVAQESFALFPLLHTAKRNNALVIGYGTGMTARTFHDLGFRNIDVAELSRDIVKLADRHFERINSRISQSGGVAMHYTDGRNFLLTQTRKFDVISIEITSIWFAGAANLYNKNFYALAKERLTADGVLQQWIQLHHISTLDLVYAIGSVRSEFKYVWLYTRGGQGIIVASNNPNAAGFPGETLLAAANEHSDKELQPEKLKSHLLLSPKGVDNLILSFDPTMQAVVSTDINLYLEHSTPKGNALGDVLQKNITVLAGFEQRSGGSPPPKAPTLEGS